MFLFETFCRAPAPATAPSRAKFGKTCGATESTHPQGHTPASVSPLWVGPATCPLPGPQNDAKKAHKKLQKREQQTSKTIEKKTPENQKNMKKTQKNTTKNRRK